MEGPINQAGINEEHIDSGESLELPDADLSPEIIEKIMKKVEDINKPKTAVHSIGEHYKPKQSKTEILSLILRNGLLGYKDQKAFDGNDRKEQWSKEVRLPGHKPVVYFNIVGENIKTVDISPWFYHNPRVATIGILFSLKPFKEFIDKNPPSAGFFYPRPFSDEIHKTFQYGANGADLLHEETGKAVPYTDNGYGLTSRVAPRWFTGIVLKTKDEISPTEIKSRAREYGFRGSRKEKYIDKFSALYRRNRHKMALEIAREMLDSTKDSSNLLPIYDMEGNLWWPKQMSYEEVKKVVTERNEIKPETKNEV